MRHHKQSAPDEQHRTAVHHSCDPLGAGEMDRSRFLLVTVIALWWRIVARKLEKSSQFAPSIENFMTRHKQSAPDDQHRTAVHHSCDPLGAGEMDEQVFAEHCDRLVVEDCNSKA
jgi:hypothetical protein